MKTLKKYFDSNYFILITYIITLITWQLQNQIVPMIYYVLMAALIIISDSRRNNIMTLIFAGIINYRKTFYESNYLLFIISISILLPLIIYDLFKSKINYKDPILKALTIFLGVNIISLINTNKSSILLGLIGIGQLAAFVLIYFYASTKSQKDDYKIISKNAIALSIAIILEFVIYFVTYDGTIVGKDIELGWGISNSVAMTCLLLIPLTYFNYIEDQTKSYIYLILVGLLAVILLSLSKGAYITIALISIPLYFFAWKCVKDKKKFWVDSISALSILVVIIFLLGEIDKVEVGVMEYLKSMKERGWFNDNARMKIYEVGFDVFLKHPIIGGGSYTSRYYLAESGIGEFLHYHNYFVQLIATVGLAGLTSFVYFIYTAIKTAWKKDFYNISVIFVFIAMSIHGLVDNTWFNPIVPVFTFIILSVINKKQEEYTINE